MSYILTTEPIGGTQREAFEALDDAFGTSDFSQGQATTVLTNHFGSTENIERMFQSLVTNGYVTEVE